jgi:predicted metal-dependent hydrolase
MSSRHTSAEPHPEPKRQMTECDAMDETSTSPTRLRVAGLDIRVEVAPTRDTVRLTVERDASVTARVPPSVDAAALTRVIEDKSQWLHEKLATRRAEAEARPDKRLRSGESFGYLGRNYRLKLLDDGPETVRLIRGRLLLRRDRQPEAAQCLAEWYRRGGERWLPRRLAEWARTMGTPDPPLRVRPLGYRWGSCSSDGTVNIHWATMQIPVDLVDYVLVHELTHLAHPNHTAEFWRSVELTLPGSARRRERLRMTGAELWLPNQPLGSRKGR